MNMKKILTMALALVLVAGLSVGGTLAYLQAQTEAVVNTFTYGNVDVELKENRVDSATGKFVEGSNLDATTNTYSSLVPGRALQKNPTVILGNESETSYVFVEFKNNTNYLECAMDTNWTVIDSDRGVYAYNEKVEKGGKANILKQDYAGEGYAVKVKEELTKENVEAMGEDKSEQLTFVAYAVQAEGFDTAKAAWNATFGAKIIA